jgi:hypothetical protein
MADDDAERSKLEPPKLFGRRKPTAAPAPVDEPVFEDAGSDADTHTEVLPVVEADDTTVVPTQPTRRVRRPWRTGSTAGGVDVADRDTDVDTHVGTGSDVGSPQEPVAAPGSPARPRRTPRDRSVPLLPGRPAAAVTGVVVGLALVGLTWVGMRGCELVRGTSSCGAAPGMAALAVIFVLTVAVGGVLLARFRIPDPGSTSFLATGLTGVICLLFLVEHLDHWSMVLVIPAITAGTFLLSWWVTTTYVEQD